jgi:hypothetical protein
MMTNEFEHPEPKIHLYHNQRGRITNPVDNDVPRL